MDVSCIATSNFEDKSVIIITLLDSEYEITWIEYKTALVTQITQVFSISKVFSYKSFLVDRVESYLTFL